MPCRRRWSTNLLANVLKGQSWSAESSGREHVLVRKEPQGGGNEFVLGRVDEGYVALQNRDAFTFFDPLVHAGSAAYENAGQLGHGQKVWVLARLFRPVRVNGSDLLLRYLLLVNTHGGASSGVHIQLTPLRVTCSNMLTAALRFGVGTRFDHTPDLVTKLSQAAECFSRIERGFSELESGFEEMAQVPLNSGSLTKYLTAVFPERTRERTEKEHALLLRLRADAAQLFEAGKGNQEPAVRGTLWAAYNGVTELIDHHVADTSPERRLERIWFGRGYEIKTRAHQVALKILALQGLRAVRTWPPPEPPIPRDVERDVLYARLAASSSNVG